MTTRDIDPAMGELLLVEPERHDGLDTPSERGFDELAKIAASVCNAPVALVTLLDRDRQVFKAHIGTDMAGTPIDMAICIHALGRRDLLVIPDLTVDPRTRNNPLVTGDEHVRFYAGAPLHVGGQTLGTLCVLDRTPRPEGLTPAQATTLRALANQVMAQFDLRRALAEREAAIRAREADQQVALIEAQRLEAMIATQQAVASAQADLGAVFQAIVDGALRVIGHADGAVVELRDGDELVYEAVSGTSARHKGIRLPLGHTLSGRAVLDERPMHCADTHADPDMNHALAIGLGIRSMIVVPVTRRGEPIGVLKIQSGKPDSFSPRDVVMAQMLAGLVASAFGDVAEVRSQRALRQAETRYRQTFESVTEFGIVVTDRDGTVTEWNTGAERIFGWTADEMRGADAERFFTPEDRAIDRVGTEMATSLRDGQAVDERWHLRKDGTRFYASGNMMPLRDDDGAHLGFIKIVRDRTEQYLAGIEVDRSRRALEDSEEKWRGLFEKLQEGFILGKVVRDAAGEVVDWRYEEVNRAWGELVGIASERAEGRTIREIFPGIEDEWVNEFADVVRTGEAIRFTRQVGELNRWYDGVCQPVGNDRFTVIFLEVTDRLIAERQREALLALGDRLRDTEGLAAIGFAASEIVGSALNATRVGFGICDPVRETVDVRQDWTAGGAASVAGLHDFRTFGSYIDDLKSGETVVIHDVRADPRTAGAGTAALEVIAVRTLVNLPVLERGQLVGIAFVHFDRPSDWTEKDTAFLRDAAERTQFAFARCQAEEGRDLLNRELVHRLKNNLALVQSIATQTLRTSPDINSARPVLTERIGALAKAHDILVTGQRDAASIREIVRSATALHDPGGRVRSSGPDVALGPKASLTLSLILHELSTNAVKYGALSLDGGLVAVVWSVAPDSGTGRTFLAFEWREADGPPVVPPTRRSFGTRLIGMGLSGAADGTSEIFYDSEGLRCRLTASLTELQASDEPAG